MRSSQHHQQLKNGVGKCSNPMWFNGGECFCDAPAYGKQTPEGKRRYTGYVPALACYGHGGPAEPFVDIVFDGPPSHESRRFVEVEDAIGRSIKFGEWVERTDGMWALRIPLPKGE